MAVVICPHGDSMCPCNEGDGGCLYEPVVIDGRISPASPCVNATCPLCRSAS